jgi:hypothetical protein
MARLKVLFIPTPRFFDADQVATRLGKSENWFREHQSRLEKKGFPKFNAEFDGWDAVAIERYIDMKSGIRKPTAADYDSDIMEAING